MSNKIHPFVNYEQFFKNNGHMFEGRNQGRYIPEIPTEIDPCCLECFVRFGIIDRYPMPLSGNGDLPLLDRKYVKMKGGVRNLSPRAERETKEINERIYEEELFLL